MTDKSRKNKKRPIKKFIKTVRLATTDLINKMLYPIKPGKNRIVNQSEIRFIGLQRSGNHAIINWIFTQAKEPRCFLNYNPVDCNPFIYFQKQGTVKEFQKDFYKDFNVPMECFGFFSDKATLIYSYEDDNLEETYTERFAKNHDRWLGKSQNCYDVIILRDPFNLFASRLKKEEDIIENRYSLKIEDQRKTLINLWKQYAREFVDKTNFLKYQKVTISYNRWVTDKDYRRQLAETLGLNFNDETMNEVLPVGGGSSFDRTSKNNDAKQMKVFDRWQFYKDDETFKDVFRDAEIIELSDQIFGDIPGVKEWIKTL